MQLEPLGYTTSSKDLEEWADFVKPFTLSYVDAEKSKLDCKTSAASIPLIKHNKYRRLDHHNRSHKEKMLYDTYPELSLPKFVKSTFHLPTASS
jgi:hypothetical protein